MRSVEDIRLVSQHNKFLYHVLKEGDPVSAACCRALSAGLEWIMLQDRDDIMENVLEQARDWQEHVGRSFTDQITPELGGLLERFMELRQEGCGADSPELLDFVDEHRDVPGLVAMTNYLLRIADQQPREHRKVWAGPESEASPGYDTFTESIVTIQQMFENGEISQISIGDRVGEDSGVDLAEVIEDIAYRIGFPQTLKVSVHAKDPNNRPEILGTLQGATQYAEIEFC